VRSRWAPCFVVWTLAVAAIGCGDATEPPAEVTLAEDFTLPQLGGGEVTLSASRGRPVVVDFWATWCAPCIKQVPMFNAIQEAFGDRVDVLAIATDAGGEEQVAPFAEEHGIAYRVLLGSETLAQQWGLIGFPTMFLIRPDGVIQEAHVGPISEDALRKVLEEMLEGE
jgi:cytochrome c biogenesis protein CcmG/thiol:disulfide interchange protein DsbE